MIKGITSDINDYQVFPVDWQEARKNIKLDSGSANNFMEFPC
ncbi:MAG: hypothetical protein AAF630_18250 [Cyanobacteria bacterium P01_C01_bin.38]